MFITFTNANGQFDGEPVIINSDNIVTVFEDVLLKGAANELRITNIFCPPHGTWQVHEPISEVIDILSKTAKGIHRPRAKKTAKIGWITGKDAKDTAVNTLSAVEPKRPRRT